jgi:LacI family transcriptional regulator
MSGRQVTLKDIARIHGISVNTVSHALRGLPDIGEQTRRQVQKTASDLGYQANIAARSLRTKQTNTIGAMITDIANPFFAEMVKGIESECQDLGYTLIVANTDEDTRREKTAVNTMLARRTDGVILIPTIDGADNALQLINESMPLVVLYRRIKNIATHMVTNNEVEGGMLAAQHLWEKGHRRFCFITAPLAVSSAFDRLDGMNRYLLSVGASGSDLLVRETDFTWRGGYQAMNDMLESKFRATAVIGFSDYMAAGILRALHERGIRVPDDMAVMGFDGSPIGELFSPALTTIDIFGYLLGKKAARLLIEKYRLSQRKSVVSIQPPLIVRQST